MSGIYGSSSRGESSKRYDDDCPEDYDDRSSRYSSGRGRSSRRYEDQYDEDEDDDDEDEDDEDDSSEDDGDRSPRHSSGRDRSSRRDEEEDYNHRSSPSVWGPHYPLSEAVHLRQLAEDRERVEAIYRRGRSGSRHHEESSPHRHQDRERSPRYQSASRRSPTPDRYSLAPGPSSARSRSPSGRDRVTDEPYDYPSELDDDSSDDGYRQRYPCDHKRCRNPSTCERRFKTEEEIPIYYDLVIDFHFAQCEYEWCNFICDPDKKRKMEDHLKDEHSGIFGRRR